MPIFDQGYQHWHGELSGHAWRWLTITRHGVRAQTKGTWRRLLVLSVVVLAWIPALVLAASLIFWGLVEKNHLPSWLEFLQTILPDEIRQDPRTFRVAIWTLAYQFFFSIQLTFCMFLVMIVGPALISQDLRFNAIPLYLSRPLRRIDYFAGKLGVIGVVLAAVAIVPPLLAWFLGVIFSFDITIVRDTYRVLIASVGGGLVVVLSAGTLMLAISSLSRNSLSIGAIWFGSWFLTNSIMLIMFGVVRENWCLLISYTTNLERIQAAMLDTDSAMRPFERLMERQQEKARQAAEMQRRIAERQQPSHRGPKGREMDEPKAPPVVIQEQNPRGNPDDGPPEQPSRFRGPTYPWYWSACVLAGLFGISVWILSLRIKTLDRLR
jgi:ABC-2 type transport system permease protein